MSSKAGVRQEHAENRAGAHDLAADGYWIATFCATDAWGWEPILAHRPLSQPLLRRRLSSQGHAPCHLLLSN